MTSALAGVGGNSQDKEIPNIKDHTYTSHCHTERASVMTTLRQTYFTALVLVNYTSGTQVHFGDPHLGPQGCE